MHYISNNLKHNKDDKLKIGRYRCGYAYVLKTKNRCYNVYFLLLPFDLSIIVPGCSKNGQHTSN